MKLHVRVILVAAWALALPATLLAMPMCCK
jgi:hypothetical protein